MNSNAVLKLMGRGGVRGGGPPRGPGRGGLRGQYNYYYWLIIDKRKFGHRSHGLITVISGVRTVPLTAFANFLF